MCDMVQVRNNIFETNSSSTHSVGISTKYDYDRLACDADDLKLDNTLLDTLAGTFVKVSEVYDRIRRNGWCSNFEEFKAFFVSNDELPDYVDYYGNDKAEHWRIIRNRYRTQEYMGYGSASGMCCDLETCEYKTSDGTIVAVSCYKEE